MKKLITTAIVLVSFILLMAFTPQTKQEKKPVDSVKGKAAQVSYKKDIIPVMKKYCLPCHTEDMMNPSELYLDTYEGIMSGGKKGKSIVAGKPDSSILIKKISLKPPFGDPMPMKRKTAFPADTLKMLRTWIEQGAKNN
ncbi:MAG: hypothetical protein HY960_06210 [Ignavibacteriae bacterium]|nr:hypothetical protein [Ignavibacteriota bacterium]